MALVQTQCWVQKPINGYYRECLAILGIEYQTWLSLILISLIVGFGGYFVYARIRKKKQQVKGFVLWALLVSLAALLVLLVFRMWWLSQTVIVY
ncbi:MAG: hypothetical protein ABIH41_02635 [Nanoarchaeota archaeon]